MAGASTRHFSSLSVQLYMYVPLYPEESAEKKRQQSVNEAGSIIRKPSGLHTTDFIRSGPGAF
jgi:hypothetical protein